MGVVTRCSGLGWVVVVWFFLLSYRRSVVMALGMASNPLQVGAWQRLSGWLPWVAVAGRSFVEMVLEMEGDNGYM